MTPISKEPNKISFSPPIDLVFIISYFFLAMIYFNTLLIDSTRCVSGPGTDVLLYFHPIRSFGFTSLSRGAFPHWNPHAFGGTPYQAMPQTALFYPLNLFFLFLPVVLAINLSAFVHIVLSGCAAYLLCRRLNQSRGAAFLSGVAYAFCAQQILRLYAGHLTITAALPWIPFFLLFLREILRTRRFLVMIAGTFIIALGFLAGHPQYFYYLLIASICYWLFFTFLIDRRQTSFIESLGTMRFLLAPLTLGILLSSAQVFPSLAFVGESARSGGLSREETGSFSLPPRQIASFVAPGIFGSDITGDYSGADYEWEMTGYCGLITLLLSVFSFLSEKKRHVIFYWALAALGLILALGKYTPFFHVFYSFLPGYRLFRGHAKALILTNLSLAVLAGFGFDALIKFYFSAKDKKKLFTIAAISVLILELGVFAFSRRSTIPLKILEDYPSMTEADDLEPSYYRQLTLITGRENSALLSGAFDVAGYDSNQLSRYRNFMNRAQNLPLRHNQLKTDIRRLSPKFLVPFGVKRVFTENAGEVPSWNAQTLDSFQGVFWTRRKIKTVSNADEALSAISETDFNFSEALILETAENPPSAGEPPLVPDQVEITNWETNQIALCALVETPCYLLISNVYAKGWKALIDGKKVPLYPANYLFQAVRLTKGKHEILLYYRPSSFTVGAIISVASLFGLILAGMIARFREKKSSKVIKKTLESSKTRCVYTHLNYRE